MVGGVTQVTSRDPAVVRSPSQLRQFVTLTLCETWGKVISTAWSPDDTLALAAGGSAGRLQVWDTGVNHNGDFWR